MREQIRAEFRRLRTTRTVFAMVLGVIALVTLGVIGIVHETSLEELRAPLHHQPFAAVVRFVIPVFLLSLGIRMFTEEFRHGSIVPTLLASPNRRRVSAAKVAVAIGAAVVFVLVAEAVAFGLGGALVSAKGAAVNVAAGPLAAEVGRMLAVGALWAAMGVEIGLVIKHQVAAAVGALAWMFVGEDIVGATIQVAARFLPVHAANAVFGVDGALLAPVAGGIVLAGWTVATIVAGAVVMQRRDVA